MDQKKTAVLLKVFTIITALVGGIFFVFYIPILIDEMASYNKGSDWLIWPGKIGIWIIGILCYAALFYFWEICTEIGNNNSFSIRNTNLMRKIGNLALTVLILLIAAGLFLLSQQYLNAAWFFLLFFLCFISSGISVICYALSFLIKNAMEIKEENDLTI